LSRIAAALNSEDLGHYEHNCDSDVLQAAGLTAIGKHLGVLIVEAKEGAAGEGSHSVARIKDLEVALQGRVRAIARRWHLRVNVEGVASKVARELILDRCNVCQGRGLIPMKYDGKRLVAVSDDQDGTAKDVECSVCLGSGQAKRDYHSRAKCAGWPEYSKRLGEWWEAVLTSCCDAELNARVAIFRRLKRESDI
jgi:hypothetical protein